MESLCELDELLFELLIDLIMDEDSSWAVWGLTAVVANTEDAKNSCADIGILHYNDSIVSIQMERSDLKMFPSSCSDLFAYASGADNAHSNHFPACNSLDALLSIEEAILVLPRFKPTGIHNLLDNFGYSWGRS